MPSKIVLAPTMHGAQCKVRIESETASVCTGAFLLGAVEIPLPITTQVIGSHLLLGWITPVADPTQDQISWVFRLPRVQLVVQEIVRGIREVSGLSAAAMRPGWIGVTCPSAAMSGWLAAAIVTEKTGAHAEDNLLYVPVDDDCTVKDESKNVS